MTNTTRKQVYARDGYRCALCDCSRGLQIHHVIPRGMGGTDSPHNLITLCSTCHAQIHGNCLEPDGMSRDEVELAAVEYLADFYAPAWRPAPVPDWLRLMAQDLADEDLPP